MAGVIWKPAAQSDCEIGLPSRLKSAAISRATKPPVSVDGPSVKFRAPFPKNTLKCCPAL